jgi:hypothetical protein
MTATAKVGSLRPVVPHRVPDEWPFLKQSREVGSRGRGAGNYLHAVEPLTHFCLNVLLVVRCIGRSGPSSFSGSAI